MAKTSAHHRKLVKDWQERNPEKVREYERKAALKKAGLTVGQYEAMFEAQGGVCAICDQPETRTHKSGTVHRLHVDHDHSCCTSRKSCGECIRGLVCHRCNVMLGYAQDDPKILVRAADYLTEKSS